VGLACIVATGEARAYRPFDQTDADVAETHAVELELGPITYTHEAAGDSYAPGFVFNYGFHRRLELVFDASKAFAFGNAAVDRDRRELDSALLVKGVLREGVLQGGSGISVAAEGGALLPTVPVAGGVGASLAFIASNRWPAATVHLNIEGDARRDRSFGVIAGAIIEGPDAWTVRPVSEWLAASADPRSTTLSALLGAIWRVRPNLAPDVAFRIAREEGQAVFEVRAGVTWAFEIH
jgi:hypothetical protein